MAESHDEDGRPDGLDEIETYEADAQGPRKAVVEKGGAFESLRCRGYRYFLVGALISNVGTWMQMVALGWLVYLLTRSSFSLGLVNFLNGAPVFFLTVFAGVVADHTNRKRLLIFAQLALMLQALVLGFMTQIHLITLSWISVLVLLGGIATTFNFPAWQAMVPDLVPKESLLNAIALNSAQFNTARLLGPMIGALVFARFGVAAVFFVNAISFLFVIWALAVIHPKQERHRRGDEGAWKMLTAGVSYVRGNSCAAMLLVSMAALTVFGMPYITLMPIVAAKTLHVGSVRYSILFAASGFGAVVGALFVARLPHDTRRDLIVRLGAVSMGAFLVLFSISRSYYLSLMAAALLGASFLSASSAINTSLQATVPPRLRGRVMALYVMAFLGLMPFSSLAFGSLGRVIGVPEALGLGGVMLVAYSLIIILRPALLAPADGPIEN